MRLITLNLWHGLAPGWAYAFFPLEPSFRRQSREALQAEWLKEQKADLILLQEANPVFERAKVLADVTGLIEFHHPDLSGVKIGRVGWPYNLNTGLVTLVNSSLSPRWVGGVQLSGPAGSWTGRLGSFQLGECRYASLVEFLHRDWGRGLVVNCHLHHGLEYDDALKAKIMRLSQDGLMTPTAATDLKYRLEEANERRQNEVKKLLEHIAGLKDRYDLVLLGGDFNSTPQSQVIQQVRQFGFVDVWERAHRTEEGGATFDRDRNLANHKFTAKFPMTIETEDLSFSPKSRILLQGILQDQEARPRRIDYLFVLCQNREFTVAGVKLGGVPQGDALAMSDHFAVCGDIHG